MVYSIDLREQAVKFVRAGGSQTQASLVFGVSRKTLFNWLGRDDLSASRRTRKSKIDIVRLVSDVQAKPDTLCRTSKQNGKKC